MNSSTPEISFLNLILNAVSTGGLVSALTLGIMAFVRSWVYPAAVVIEYRDQIKELTMALKESNIGIARLADAWEARNQADAASAKEAMLVEKLRQELAKETK